jgi:Predicted transcriptional regulators
VAPVARDEQALRDFSERMSSAMTAAGFPRMPARVLMALTVADADGLTASELADQLAVSPGAISGAVRYLQTVGMVRRVSQPGSRRDLYELPHNAWYTASMRASPVYDSFLALVPIGIHAAGGAESIAGERLIELEGFYRFLQRRMPELLREWDEERRART